MNPTRALVLKDLRLSLDTLVPWALIVVGLAVFGVVLREIPTAMPWVELDHLGFGEFLFLVAMIIGGSAPIVAAWSTGAIVHGDRSHGAEMLTGLVPVAGWSRALAKLVAIVGAVLLPLAVALPVAALGISLDDQSRVDASEFGRLSHFFVLATVLVVGFVLAAAPLSTTIRGTLARAIFFGVAASIAAALGYVLAWLVLVGYGGDRSTVIVIDDWWPMDAIFPIEFGGLVPGVGPFLAALFGAATGLRAIARGRPVRRIMPALGVMLAAAVVGGALPAWVCIERQLRVQPGSFEIMPELQEIDAQARDRDAARRIDGIKGELEPIRSSKAEPATLDAMLHQDVLRRLRAPVRSNDQTAERAATLLERPESVDLGGWEADRRR